jgi:hypothetical protein
MLATVHPTLRSSSQLGVPASFTINGESGCIAISPRARSSCSLDGPELLKLERQPHRIEPGGRIYRSD